MIAYRSIPNPDGTVDYLIGWGLIWSGVDEAQWLALRGING